MKTRKKFFDDRVLYDPKTNKIWIGRPDTKTNNEPWDFFFRSGDVCFWSTKGPPKRWVEISREPEFSIC